MRWAKILGRNEGGSVNTPSGAGPAWFWARIRRQYGGTVGSLSRFKQARSKSSWLTMHWSIIGLCELKVHSNITARIEDEGFAGLLWANDVRGVTKAWQVELFK
jgi:hypothetical protein